MKKEFKTGDQVKIIGKTPYSGHKIGDIGILERIDNNNSFGVVRVPGTSTSKNQEYYYNLKHYQEEIVTDVIIEEEFVLPETWHVIVTKENREVLSNWRTDYNSLLNITDLVGMTIDNNGRITKGHNSGKSIKSKDFGLRKWGGFDFGKEITFEQFKQYVLKEKPEIKPLPFFKALRISYKGNITQAQNNEGNVFLIGDMVRSITGRIKEPETMRILGFRYNNDKTNICAITQRLEPYGIGIDKIEHVIDFKKDEVVVDIVEPVIESNLDKAKRLYPVGTVFNAARGAGSRYTVMPNSKFRENTDGAICIQSDGNGTIYAKGNWALIISKPEVKQESSLSDMLKQSETIHNEKYDKIVKTIEKEETLLEKARRLFPIGTRFNCLFNSNEEWEIIELSRSWGDAGTTIVARATPINAKIRRPILKTLYFPSRNWAKILHTGYKVGDTINVFIHPSIGKMESGCKGETQITRLETINGQEVAFFGINHPSNRILTKNIKK